MVDYASSSLVSMVKSKPKPAHSTPDSSVNNSIDHQKSQNSEKKKQKTKDPSPKGGGGSSTTERGGSTSSTTQHDHRKPKKVDEEPSSPNHPSSPGVATPAVPPSQYRSPTKPSKKDINLESKYDMQIKTQEEFNKENGLNLNSSTSNSPNKQLDFTTDPSSGQEVKRLNRDLNRLKKLEGDLRKQIKDLVQHEDFTREELDSLRKRENQIRSHLNKEKERRIEVELSLKREEELRRTSDRNLAEERRKNSNTAELEQTKQRVRSLEMEQETLRKVPILLFNQNSTFHYIFNLIQSIIRAVFNPIEFLDMSTNLSLGN